MSDRKVAESRAAAAPLLEEMQVSSNFPLFFLLSAASLRGFTGTETDDGVWVPSQAKKVLSSPLTTVFLPVLYIAVFAVALPTNAMALWVFLFR